MDYIVSFEYSDTVYCANWVTTDDPRTIDEHYGKKYKWYAYHEATTGEVETAMAKGMPHRTYVGKEN